MDSIRVAHVAVEPTVGEEPPKRIAWSVILVALVALAGLAVGGLLLTRDPGPAFSLDEAMTSASDARGTRSHVTEPFRGVEIDVEINNDTGLVHVVLYRGNAGSTGTLEAIVDIKADVMYLNILGTDARTKLGAPVAKWLKIDRAALDGAGDDPLDYFGQLSPGSTVNPSGLISKAKRVEEAGLDEVNGEKVKHYLVTVSAEDVVEMDLMLQWKLRKDSRLFNDIVFDMYVTEGNEIRRVAYDDPASLGEAKVDTVQHVLTEPPLIEIPNAEDVTDFADVDLG